MTTDHEKLIATLTQLIILTKLLTALFLHVAFLHSYHIL